MTQDWLKESRDGSFSAYNADFDECYHSLKDGALSESLHKHIYPALTHLQGVFHALPDTLYVLDICFGLGYNAFTLLSTLAHNHFKGKVIIYSPEQDAHLFCKLCEFTYPDYINAYRQCFDEILYFYENSPNARLCRISVKIHTLICDFYAYKGNALDILSSLPSAHFHIIFQDAFSPKKNQALWSESYFRILFSLLHPQGIITTYSQSKAIRHNALLAGFKVYNYENTFTRGGSVISKDKPQLQNLKIILINT